VFFSLVCCLSVVATRVVVTLYFLLLHVMSSTDITTDVPTSVAITVSPVWRTFDVNSIVAEACRGLPRLK
jgi:hypothetical protein